MHDLIGRSGKKETGVPLIVTYYPRFHNLNNIIRRHFTFLYAEEQVKSVFTPAPPLDGTHLVAVRGLTTKRYSSQERQREELAGASLLRSIRTNRSSLTCRCQFPDSR